MLVKVNVNCYRIRKEVVRRHKLFILFINLQTFAWQVKTEAKAGCSGTFRSHSCYISHYCIVFMFLSIYGFVGWIAIYGYMIVMCGTTCQKN